MAAFPLMLIYCYMVQGNNRGDYDLRDLGTTKTWALLGTSFSGRSGWQVRSKIIPEDFQGEITVWLTVLPMDFTFSPVPFIIRKRINQEESVWKGFFLEPDFKSWFLLETLALISSKFGGHAELGQITGRLCHGQRAKEFQLLVIKMVDKTKSVLLVNGSNGTAQKIEESLRDSCFKLHSVSFSGDQIKGENLIEEEERVFLMDLTESREDGLGMIPAMKALDPGSPLLALVTSAELSTAKQALDAGADEILFPDQLTEASLPNHLQILIHQRQKEDRQPAVEPFPTLLQHIQGMAYRCVNDSQWPMLTVSPGSEDLTGYKAQELIQGEIAFGDLIHIEDRRRVWEDIQEAVQTDRTFKVQYRLITKEGKTKWVQEEGRPTAQRQDEKFILEGYITDITPHMQAKQARASSQQKYFQLFQSIRDAILVTDPERRIVDCNPAFMNLFEYTLEDIQGRKTELIYENQTEFQELGREIEEADRTEDFFYTVKYRKKSGEVFPGETNVFFLTDHLGKVTSFVGLIRDVSVRQKAFQQLEESRTRYRELFEQVPIGLYRTTPQGRLTHANHTLVHLLGYPDRQTLLDVDVSDLYVNPQDEVRWRDRIAQEQVVENLEVQLITYDGSKIWARDNSRTIHDAAGQVTAYQGSLEDITAQVQAREKVKKYSSQLEALQEISVELVSELDLDELLLDIVDAATALVQGSAGGVNIIHRDRDILTLDVHSQHGTLPQDTALKRGEGLMGKVWEQQKSLRVPDYAAWEHAVPTWSEHYGHQAVIGVPILWGDSVLGVLELLREPGHPFSEDDLHILELFAAQAAAAMHNARIFAQAQKRLDRLKILRDIDQAISSSLDIELALNLLLGRLKEDLQVDAAAIHLYNPQLHTLTCRAHKGLHTGNIEEEEQQLGRGQAGRVAYQRQRVHIPDLTLEAVDFERADLIQEEDFTAYFGIPLLAKGEILGVLEVFHRTPLDPTVEWIQFLETMAGQAALAIDHLKLFHDLQRSNLLITQAYNQVIEGWARALELKDRETEGHSQRVVNLTLAVARELGLSGEQMLEIRQGALLHDIGKMGIPDQIIQKPGPLSEEEWELMKKHPEFARKMLEPIDHLRGALDIPYSHHERWDGSGYPQGLAGEEIPLPARIFAVVDVWDALLSDRPYRKAWPRRKVLAYIEDQMGKLFDPRVVRIFLDLISQGHPR